jgi:acetoin utilization deacetylase AcuC-like enzyme
VLFVSIHQSPLYPGTGPARDSGSGPGEGYTVNLPVPEGAGDPEFCGLVEHVVAPLMHAYEPALVLVSAGYDAHAEDPLAGCRMTEAGYAAMASCLQRAAREVGAPLGCVLEGGYALGALARSVAATMAVLGGAGEEPERSVAGPEAGSPASRELVAEARARVARFWPTLAAGA